MAKSESVGDARGGQKPTPVRAIPRSDVPSPGSDPDVEQVEVVVDDVEWKVRVIGRAGGAGPRGTPLLMLGFWDGPSVEGTHDREALVVGRTLALLPRETLEVALGKLCKRVSDRAIFGLVANKPGFRAEAG